ncbi:MAG: IS1 family transposase [Clostridia bacterium]|nr:IS1 family transposase [Clostridia bacterium]
MAIIEVKCPKCWSAHVIKYGRTSTGTQRYLCKDCKDSFLLEYTYNAYKPGTEETIIKMTANASGIRDISRVVGISTDTVIKTLKKQNVR